jgi:hypothetical protein
VLNTLPQLQRLIIVQRRPSAMVLQALRNPNLRWVTLSLREEIEEDELKRDLATFEREVRDAFLNRQEDAYVSVCEQWSLFGSVLSYGSSLRSSSPQIKRTVRWRLGSL